MRLFITGFVSVLATLAVVTPCLRERPVQVEGPGRAALQAIARLVELAPQWSFIPATQAPFSTEELHFVLGNRTSQVLLVETPEGCRVVWDDLPLCEVTPYLEGELPNGLDDNGNGLIDERGLAFTFDGEAVTVRLSALSGSAVETLEATIVLPEPEGWGTGVTDSDARRESLRRRARGPAQLSARSRTAGSRLALR